MTLRRFLPCLFLVFVSFTSVSTLRAQASPADPQQLYDGLTRLELSGDAVQVAEFSFVRDRLRMTLTGDVHLGKEVEGKVYYAVFTGQGRITVEGWSKFEKDSIKRFLKSESVDETFTRAVFRFTDDSAALLQAAGARRAVPLPEAAAKQAAALDARMHKHLGLNLTARQARAVVHGEPGLFFAEFDGGKRGNFAALIDPHGHLLGEGFGLDGGEKGVVYQDRGVDGVDLWTAFYSEADMASGRVAYSDAYYVVQPELYHIKLDLMKPQDVVKMETEIELIAGTGGARLVPMRINESLSDYDNLRLKKGMRLLEASLDGAPLPILQEKWEAGFTLVLPRAYKAGERFKVNLKFEGTDYMTRWGSSYYYPISTTTWYPRHGHLQRSRFRFTFQHKLKTTVVVPGQVVREADEGNVRVTEAVLEDRLALVSFAVGDFVRHKEQYKRAGTPLPLEFYSLPGSVMEIKEDFMLAELINGVHFYSELFSPYPYPLLKAVYFPGNFGQGFPTMLLLPSRGSDSTGSLAFIAHEVAHQWWGNVAAWRSYRDQWLSEGFAEYSGALYAARRDNPKRAMELVDEWRDSILQSPRTETGIAKGRLADIGPLIMGYRVSSRHTMGAYSALAYSKGALVLRMLHFMFSDPANGTDEAFYAMMKDFVKSHAGGWASTESFFEVANQHFANAPLAKRFGLKDLRWFQRQWVMGTTLPKYRIEYQVVKQPEGPGAVVKGTVFQENAPEDFFMPLPVVVEFSGKRGGTSVVHAYGPKTEFAFKVPEQPVNVKFDPSKWVLSEETSQKHIR